MEILNQCVPNINLPRDVRCLYGIKVPENSYKQMNPDLYFHFDVKNGIRYILNKVNFEKSEHINLELNVDGLPLSKSSAKEFWPILCKIENLPFTQPFLVGIFEGNAKPENPEIFLRPFVDEISRQKGNKI